eukprot:1219800-Alexandrium_andersonii.AAC.1
MPVERCKLVLLASRRRGVLHRSPCGSGALLLQPRSSSSCCLLRRAMCLIGLAAKGPSGRSPMFGEL